MIQTAVSGAENYVEAGEIENEVMQDTADYIDSIVASIKGEDTSGGGSSGTGTDLSTLSETERLALVGQYVDYTPDYDEYTLITGSSTYTGTTENDTDFTTDTDLNWQIWSIDDDELVLIADDVQDTGGYYYSSYGYYTLYLTGNLGYNNGVKLLNDICETCYSSSSVNGTGVKATARSLSIQDIEEVIDWRKWSPTSYYYSSSYDSYTYISTKQYTSSSYRYYPGLWPEEDYANIDGTTVKEASYTYDTETGELTYTGSGLRRSDQTDFCTTARGQAGTYIEPTETYWKAIASTLSNAWVDSKYASVVDISKYYWLASRCVYLDSLDASFGLQGMVPGGGVRGYSLYYSYDSSVPFRHGVRPVVEIPLSSLALDLTSNTGDTSDDAYQIVAK